MAAIALAAGTAPAAAQNFSNSYTFIKAVKDRDGAKVTSVLAEPGSTRRAPRSRARATRPCISSRWTAT
jgi:hypothetical protein